MQRAPLFLNLSMCFLPLLEFYVPAFCLIPPICFHSTGASLARGPTILHWDSWWLVRCTGSNSVFLATCTFGLFLRFFSYIPCLYPPGPSTASWTFLYSPSSSCYFPLESLTFGNLTSSKSLSYLQNTELLRAFVIIGWHLTGLVCWMTFCTSFALAETIYYVSVYPKLVPVNTSIRK